MAVARLSIEVDTIIFDIGVAQIAHRLGVSL